MNDQLSRLSDQLLEEATIIDEPNATSTREADVANVRAFEVDEPDLLDWFESVLIYPAIRPSI